MSETNGGSVSRRGTTEPQAMSPDPGQIRLTEFNYQKEKVDIGRIVFWRMFVGTLAGCAVGGFIGNVAWELWLKPWLFGGNP